ncbi:MAG TPA: sigma-70 family RNA polymerase sigma factor [Labilithrix sp.]
MPASTTRPTAKSQAEARFRNLVAEHYDFIWRSLRGSGVASSSVDDAAQQVFLVAAQKLDAIAPGSERSFLFATARGVAANARRSASRRREVVDDDAILLVSDDEANPERLTAQKRARELLDRIIASIPDDLREAFILFELEGMTMAEIAELLSLPAGTVASRLRRAREEFQAAARRLRGGVQ